MHEGSLFRDIEYEDFFEVRFSQQSLCEGLYSGSARPLRQSDSYYILAEQKDISALKAQRVAVIIPFFGAGRSELRIEFIHILQQQAFTASGSGAHVVYRHSVSDACALVTCEVHVRHRIHIERICLIDLLRKSPRLIVCDIAFPDSRDHLVDKLPGRHSYKIRIDGFLYTAGREMHFIKHLSQKTVLDLRFFKGLGCFVSIVNYFDAILSENVREAVVFLLSYFQIRNIVKQKPGKIVRHESVHLTAYAVEQHLFKFSDLRIIMYSCYHPYSFPARAHVLLRPV